jgi:hypothetical protein
MGSSLNIGRIEDGGVRGNLVDPDPVGAASILPDPDPYPFETNVKLKLNFYPRKFQHTAQDKKI